MSVCAPSDDGKEEEWIVHLYRTAVGSVCVNAPSRKHAIMYARRAASEEELDWSADGKVHVDWVEKGDA